MWILSTIAPETDRSQVEEGLVNIAPELPLSPGALRAFFNIMDRWQVRDEYDRDLLGGITNGPYYALKKRPTRTLDADTLLRVSYMVGIFKSLHILHDQAFADQWVRLANSNLIFSGQTLLPFMRQGGLPAMQTVHRPLDARRGGL